MVIVVVGCWVGIVNSRLSLTNMIGGQFIKNNSPSPDTKYKHIKCLSFLPSSSVVVLCPNTCQIGVNEMQLKINK